MGIFNNMATLLLIVIYFAFISLGLPDALLGSGWPVIQPYFGVPYSYAGFVTILISSGTILSSIFSSSVIRRFGTGLVTAVSVALTAAALFGFALAPSFAWFFLAAIPLGFGAGAVDAGLNAFVAEHYASRHMSWLHCFWGIGALSGPLVLSACINQGMGWKFSYLTIGTIQVILVGLLFLSLPLWAKVKHLSDSKRNAEQPVSHTLFSCLKIRGVLFALLIFFSYCGIEASMGLWGSSYLFKVKDQNPAAAAAWVSIFYGCITAGRFLTGFLTYKMSNKNLIRSGCLIIVFGVFLILLPFPLFITLAGFLLVGLGCAPIFPCMIHETPFHFGRANSQAILGFQMASAYIGATFLPPAFGFIAASASMSLLPFFLLGYVLILLFCSEALRKMN